MNKKIILKIISILAKSQLVYIFSKKIGDYHHNDNNCEIKTNGELDFILKNKERLEVIFDVGANIGEWTDLVSKIIPTAYMYSFEPSKNTFKILSEKKHSDRVRLYNIGLGEKKETANFYTYDNDSTLNSIYVRVVNDNKFLQANNIKTETIELDSIDNFCQINKIERISFLKIDVEGNELSVLKGGEQYIKEGKIDKIQFEYGGTFINAHISLKDIFIFFENKPYTISKIMQNGLKQINNYNECLENYQYSNYIAIRKDKF